MDGNTIPLVSKPASPNFSDLPTTGLGIDAGGTSTRWAIADVSGQLLAEGRAAGLTALMMGNQAGRVQTAAVLRQLARDVAHACDADGARLAVPQRVLAGFTGYSDAPPVRAALETLIAGTLNLPEARVLVVGDIALAYLDCFAPGDGYLVYAGTGSIAAYIDAGGHLYRAGGRGALLDDGGSGYWIAREAVRSIWRAEDERPGSWRNSEMARAVCAHIGGSEWVRTRDFFYQSTRGQIGELAVAVAAAATAGDAVATGLVQQAGVELARLAQALVRRFGERPVALAGGAAQLHPAIETSMRAALAGHAPALRVARLRAHETAARMAARNDPLLTRFTDAETDDPPRPANAEA